VRCSSVSSVCGWFRSERPRVTGVKRPGNEAGDSLPSSAEVRNEWNCTSLPPICVCSVCLDIKSLRVLTVIIIASFKLRER
jgi:hypothetical protein